MSILHDSLERHRRETASQAGSSATWNLRAPPPSFPAGLRIFTRKSWVLLGALILFSLGAWGTVQLWPVSGGRGTASTSLSDSRRGNVEIRAPLVQPEEAWRHGPATVQAGSERTVEARSLVPSRPISSRAEDAPNLSAATSQNHLMARQSPNAPDRARPLAAQTVRSSASTVDQRTLEELNLRLSRLLAALPRPIPERGDAPGDLFTAPALDGADNATGHAPRHVPAPVDQAGPLPMEHQPSDQARAASPPMVHVAVYQSTEPTPLPGIRSLEEELGRALRARNWEAFELALDRLADLQPGDALVRWRAARAMAQGDYEGARTLLESLHRDNPLNLRTGLNLALVYEAQGEIEAARSIARALARRHPLDSGLQTLLDRLENRRMR